MARKEYAVGIDLGTTYSCVAVWRNGKVEVIPNDQGNRIMPSCVSFHNGERLVGEAAVNLAARNPANTIFGVKRLIGRRYREESVQDDKKNWSFEVVEVDDVRPAIVVQHNGERKHLYPEQISSMVLGKLKVCAETFLGTSVTKAVVTVPAYFNNSQRQATKDACQIAGLEVTHVLNEPTAAAMAYELHTKDLCKDHGRRKVLIFDLGGGTLDVSLLELDQHGVVEVKATAGDTHLGGEDFDNRMVDHLAGVFQSKTNIDIRGNMKCRRKLKSECEKIKRQLSTMLHAEIFLESFYDGEDFTGVTFTRAKFEELNKDLFDRCIFPLKRCLEDAKVDKSKVDEVVLVGGSTRIPKIQEMLKDFFNGKKLNLSINPDEAVACGAAIQAASLNENGSDQKGPDVALLDVTPLSLGLENYEGIVKKVIPRNTRIPCKVVRPWYTAYDNQTSVNFPVYEGERPMGKDNNLLGMFKLEGLRKAPKGKVEFQVVFQIDRNGILKVSATNTDNQDKKSITITRDKMTLNKDEIDRMIRESIEFENSHKDRVKAVQAKEKLKEYVSGIEKLMDGSSKVASKLSKESRNKVESALDKAKKWIESHSAAAYYDYDMQKSVLQSVWEPVRRELELTGENFVCVWPR